MTLSWGIGDQIILQSDWKRDIIDHTHAKAVVLDAALNKSKVLIDSIQRYWWWKNTAIWLAKSILGNNWRTKFSQAL